MNNILDEKVALITGAGSGIGFEVLKAYIEQGARVGVLEINPEKAKKIQKEFGDDVAIIVGDASKPSDLTKVVDATISKFDKIDILIPNTGVFDGNTALSDMSIDQVDSAFDELFNVNVKGYLLAVRAALPELVKTKGSIVMTASFGSFHTSGGGILYTASKHAVVGLIRQLAYELAPFIRVNGVAPGGVDTLMKGLGVLGQSSINALLPGSSQALPLGVMPETEQYTWSYVFLGSNQMSSVITGSVINADSGKGIRGMAKVAGGQELGQRFSSTD